MKDRTCPYCVPPVDASVRMTADHVFVDALGGRAKVRACKACNDAIGSKVEGPLQQPGTLLHLARAPQPGKRGTVIAGSLVGQQVVYDLNTHELRAAKPVEITREGDVENRRVGGSLQQVRRVLTRDMRMSRAQADELIAAASRVEFGAAMVQSTVTHDLKLGDRLTAKVALGAARMVDAAFHATDLAANLRGILWNEIQVEASQRIPLDALATYEALFTQIPGMSNEPLLPPQSSRLGAALFIQRGDRTAVFAQVAGVSPSMAGIVVPGVWAACRDLPVAVYDEKPLRVRRLTDEFAAAMAHAGSAV